MTDIQLIVIALRNHADLCRRQAARRDLTGPGYADIRANKRAEGHQAEELALKMSTRPRDTLNQLAT